MSKANVKFRKFGRSWQAVIQTAEDLLRACELDKPLWVATTAPISQMQIDAEFRARLDFDGDGRVTCDELRQAVACLRRNLRDLNGVTAGAMTLRLDDIEDEYAEGQMLRQSAEKILSYLHAADTEEISLDQVRQVKAQLEKTPVSAAGVILPAAADDADVRQYISDIVSTMGGEPHPDGSIGVSDKLFRDFIAAARAYLAWYKRGQIPEGQAATDICPLGEATTDVFALLTQLEPKLDQYFAQCQLLALDERFSERVGLNDVAFRATVNGEDTEAIRATLAEAPIAPARPDGVLPLNGPINPHDAAALRQLMTHVDKPILGRPAEQLTAGQWEKIRTAFVAHRTWLAEKAGGEVESLGVETLQRYVSGELREKLQSLLNDSTDAAFAMENVRVVEKMILYQAYLLELANNFIALPRLYHPQQRAIFEKGSLVMDGRRFNFAVIVDDRAAHARVAQTGNIFLMYVQIDGSGMPPYTAAVPVTSGGKGNLVVGKRGVFTDIDGAESTAQIVQIVENPISLSEAAIAPFKRIGQLISGKIEKMTSTAEHQLDVTTQTALDGQSQTAAPAAPSKLSGGMSTGGLLMGGGVAIAALGSSFAYISQSLSWKNVPKLLLIVGVAVLAVLVPMLIVAVCKLRRRDLSTVLEASGWGINARMRLSWRQARYFTQRPRLPRPWTATAGAWIFWLMFFVAIAAVVYGIYYLWLRGA